MNWLRIISYVVLTLLIVPILVLLYEGLGPMRTPSGYNSVVFRSIELTLLGSTIAVLVAVVLYTPLAYYFARNESTFAQGVADLPASIPHPIVGIALLILVSPLSPIGRVLISVGFDLFNTLLGYVVCLVIVSAPIYIKAMMPFYESMNRSAENYASGLGASQLRRFVSIVLPNSGRGILSASLIAMARGMSEYGSIAIIAYELLSPPFYGISPISVYIVTEYESANLAAAVTTSAVMIVISFAITFAFRLLQSPRFMLRAFTRMPRG
jgi:molybdate/tungstate transport system permease protein